MRGLYLQIEIPIYRFSVFFLRYSVFFLVFEIPSSILVSVTDPGLLHSCGFSLECVRVKETKNITAYELLGFGKDFRQALM